MAWTRQFGTNANDDVYDISVDSSGDSYVGGYTFGALSGTNAGQDDLFVAKYDASGNRQWLTQLGTSAQETVYRVAHDASGNLYAAGTTLGSLGGTNPGTTNHMSDPYLAKFDASGTKVWLKQFGTSDNDNVHGLTIRSDGDILVAGDTAGTMQGTNAGQADAFVGAYDATGTQLWLTQFGGAGDDRAEAMGSDASGNAYVTGRTTGSLQGTNAGGFDVFLAKFGTSGAPAWTRQLGSAGDDEVIGMATASNGDSYLGGQTTGALAGTNAGGDDAFLAKYDSAGNQAWVRQFGTSGDEDVEGVAFDGSGNILVTGYTTGDLGKANAGQGDVYVAAYDPAGNRLWLRQFGKAGDEYGQGVGVDGAGNIYIGGGTSSSLQGSNAGGYDAYVLKYWH